jgi:hypothetical protein
LSPLALLIALPVPFTQNSSCRRGFEQRLFLPCAFKEIKTMPLFTFSLDSFQITQTRSAHKDTDYVVFTVRKNAIDPPESFPVTALGNLNNGTFNIGFTSADNTIYPDSPVVLNYLIVNSSMGINAVTSALSTISDDLALGPLLGLPPLTSALEYVSTQYARQLSPIIKPGSCDGLVAAEQINMTYEELVSYTARSPYFQQATSHIGSKAPGGCNSKPSAYVTHWSMKQVATVPNVTNLPVGTSKEQGTAAQVLSAAGFQLTPVNGNPDKLWVKAQSIYSPPTQSISQPVTVTTTTTPQ